jgi:hypothetical protein
LREAGFFKGKGTKEYTEMQALQERRLEERLNTTAAQSQPTQPKSTSATLPQDKEKQSEWKSS